MIASASDPRDPFATHAVLNQSAPLEDYNLFDTDRALGDALAFNCPPDRLPAARGRFAELGARETFAQADAANRFPPELRAFGTLAVDAPFDALIERDARHRKCLSGLTDSHIGTRIAPSGAVMELPCL